MNKVIALFAILSAGLLFGINFGSAATYYGNSNQYNSAYSFRSTNEQVVYPSYTTTPSFEKNIAGFNDNSASYSRNYQGPVIERTYYYNEDLNVKKADKFTKSISIRQAEKYLGEYDSISASTQDRNSYSDNYKQSSATNYNGGSAWRYAPQYDYRDYGRESYYYKPRYDSSSGYYNWRY